MFVFAGQTKKTGVEDEREFFDVAFLRSKNHYRRSPGIYATRR